MNPRLLPLLAVYDEDVPAGAPAPEAAGADVEEALLRATRAAIEACGRPAPPPEAVAAVLAAAREAAAGSELGPLRAALRGDPRDGSAESALLATTLEALGRLPREAPPAAALAAIEEAATTAAMSSELVALRNVLAGGPDDSAEAAVLRTTLDAVSRVPRRSPPADVVASVVAAAGRAARASELEPVRAVMEGRASAEDAEAAILSSTWSAVAVTPREAPPVAAIQAVLAAAHEAVPAPLREANRARERAVDRPAVAQRRTRFAFVYLTAALALAGLVSVSLWITSGGPRGSETQATGALDEMAGVAPQSPAPEADASADADQPAASTAPPTRSEEMAAGRTGGPGAMPLIAADARAAFAAPSPPPPPPPAPVAQAAPAEMEAERPAREATVTTGVGLAQADRRDDSPGAGLAGAPAVAPAWEAGADVRVLSLRLAAMQEQAGGVAWDEPPTALGAAEEGGRMPAGLEAVGTTPAPARVQVRVGPPGR